MHQNFKMTCLRMNNLFSITLFLLIETIFCVEENYFFSLQSTNRNISILKLSKASNFLAMNLHRTLTRDSSENVIFSPFSISIAFAMLYHGTRGIASEELRKTLGYETADLNDYEVHSSYQHLLTTIKKQSSKKAYTLSLANSILVDKSYELIPKYKDEMQKLYEAVVSEVNFRRDTAKIMHDVNRWVKVKTNGKIDILLENLDPLTILLLLNAVYFKGIWKTQFETTKTRPRVFYSRGLESEAKQVSMMHITSRFSYVSLSDCEALEMPYKDGNFSMLILLPNDRNGLKSLEDNLTMEKLNNIRSQLYNSKVAVYFPKFKIQFFKEISRDLELLGAKRIFQKNADFSGMTSREVFVNQVLHKVVMEVNVKGSEAAAVTGIGQTRSQPSRDIPIFNADHPFVVFILDTQSEMILFQGRVNVL